MEKMQMNNKALFRTGLLLLVTGCLGMAAMDSTLPGTLSRHWLTIRIVLSAERPEVLRVTGWIVQPGPLYVMILLTLALAWATLGGCQQVARYRHARYDLDCWRRRTGSDSLVFAVSGGNRTSIGLIKQQPSYAQRLARALPRAVARFGNPLPARGLAAPLQLRPKGWSAFSRVKFS